MSGTPGMADYKVQGTQTGRISSKKPTLEEVTTPTPISERSKFWTTVIYSGIGKRKTTTACRMVKNHGLLVAADNSWSTLLKPQHQELRDKVELLPYNSTIQLMNLPFEDFDTIILDTFDGMVDKYLDVLLQHGKWPDGGYRDQIISVHPELKGATARAMADYGVIRDKFSVVIEHLVDQPVHLVFVCHVNDPGPLQKDKTRRPNLPNATWLELARPADIVGFIQGDDKKGFTINIDESSVGFAAKSRMDGLSGKPTLDEFVRKYHEGSKGA